MGLNRRTLIARSVAALAALVALPHAAAATPLHAAWGTPFPAMRPGVRYCDRCHADAFPTDRLTARHLSADRGDRGHVSVNGERVEWVKQAMTGPDGWIIRMADDGNCHACWGGTAHEFVRGHVTVEPITWA